MKKHKRVTIAALIAFFCVMAFGAESCEDGKENSSSDRGQKLTEEAYAKQEAAVPYPMEQLNDSLERRNLKERLLRQNEADRIGYVYFVSFGKFLGYWTIEGKVSSTQSQMTPADITDYACEDGLSGCQSQVLQAPGDDGSYGENEPGVFFFTTDDVMVQLPADSYVYSDAPIALNNVPELNGAAPTTGGN